MSSDRDAMIAAILASPDDDGPRRIFADWLEEQGKPAGALYLPGLWVLVLQSDKDGYRSNSQALWWLTSAENIGGTGYCLGTEFVIACQACTRPAGNPALGIPPLPRPASRRYGGQWICEPCWSVAHLRTTESARPTNSDS